MRSMRDIITMCEAQVASPMAASSDCFPQVMKIYTLLKAEDFEFTTALVSRTVEIVNSKSAEFAQAAAREREYLGAEFNPTDWVFDRREHFLEIVTPLMQRATHSYAARTEAENEAASYQHTMAVDLGYTYDYVETSSFFTALDQQRVLGRSIDLGKFDPAKVATWAPFLAEIQDVIDTMAHFDPNSEHVAPRWLSCIHKDLSQIVPLMMFMARNKIV